MLAATSVHESRAPGRSATGSDSSKFCYHRNRGAQAVLRSSDRGEPPRPGPGRRSGLGVSRRSPHPFRTHREPLPPGPRDAPPRDRRGHARRDAGGLGEPGVLSARARGGRAAAHRRLHALHDGDLPGARRADRLDPLLHRPGQARLSIRLRARPGQRAHRRRRGAALPAPRRPVRALRGRARVRATGPLPRPSAPPVHRVELRMIAPALDLERLRGLPEDALDDTLRSFADAHGAEALPVLAARAWVSGVDGSGSRALWILFEGGFGSAALCSLIVNDAAGVLEVAGGGITKRRLEAELAALRSSQKLPWVECDPARALGLVAEALALHRAQGTAPPDAFARWSRLFDGADLPAPPALPAADPALVERSAALAELPEMAGWFLDPEAVQVDAVELLAARESRLVVSDQVKAEREDAIVGRVIARELGPEARRRWARRLAEMALVFDATERADTGGLARAAAAALADPDADVSRHPFARALTRRALEVAAEVASGRLRASDVSRKPGA